MSQALSGSPTYKADFRQCLERTMNAISTQLRATDTQQQHNHALDLAAAETCRRSPNSDRLDTSVLAAKLHAARSANESMLPQTIFRTPHTAGWWHTNCYSRVLDNAEVFATILPTRYCQ
jgi:hypothetical protein